MTKQVRRTAALMMLLFLALFVNLNVIQVLRADEFTNHPGNGRLIIKEYQLRRGPIVVGGAEVASSVLTDDDDDLKYLRRYESADLYAHLMGYYSFVLNRDGLERTLNETLTGTSTAALAQNLFELFGQRDPIGNTVQLTIEPTVQQAAVNALDGRPGAIVAIDPLTGDVLAHVSSPTYDPNRLSSHDGQEIRTYWDELLADPADPLTDRAIEERYQPGSTMKLIVAAAALEHGITPDTKFEDTASYTPPQTTKDIENYGGGTCDGGGTITLARALTVSCNTVFARLGVELGSEALVDQAEAFGFNRDIPYELDVADSVIPKELDQPATAQSALGARDVQATALQMAMVSGAIANDGRLRRPHVVAEVLDPTGRPVSGPTTGPWIDGPFTAEAVSHETAATLFDMMVTVVAQGTGRAAQIDGAIVGGKTGTADPGEEITPHAWFTGFAATTDPGGQVVPKVAVAVVLPNAGEGATGGGTAAPMARAVMEAALAARTDDA